MTWFDLPGDARLGACATDGCGGQPTKRLEAGGVGSYYCSGCAEKIDQIIAPSPNPDRSQVAALGEAETRQEPAAWRKPDHPAATEPLFIDAKLRTEPWMMSVFIVPLYTHPSPTVTDEMVEAAARALDGYAFASWQRSYDFKKSETGDAKEAKAFADRWEGSLVESARSGARAALTAALKVKP